ncbi:glutaminyl-peptide cyclotransferase [Mucilaginibacter sp. dw_454]|uniref:glutaminyl-peptide cyclotransferase n=1 Tax=Mucilaginibacter sp. dw_454 TaxID=2720079 RepID=UPI001BD3A349|nr:glutaminyl-peptide cyclotransferase [Mucilaginibacter sp. dw_454]
MKIKSLLLFAAIALFAACKHKPTGKVAITMTPEAGFGIGDDKPVPTSVHYPAGFSPDSVVYYIDSVRLGSKPDSSAFNIETKNLHMGMRTIMAKVWSDGQVYLGMTTFYKVPKEMPERLTFNVIAKFPHDTAADTHGLSYDNGFLYESVGDTTHGEIRKVDLATGKVLIRQRLPGKHYAKGNTILGDKVLVLADKEHVGYIFDKNTLRPEGTFTRTDGANGGGITTDGKTIFYDDGTNRIWTLNKDSFKKIDFIDVYDHESPVNLINELEYVEGKIYSNVYSFDTIVIIDPVTGAVNQAINLMNLWPFKDRPKTFNNEDNVINGIAYDAKGKRLFVTGRHWQSIYQIEIAKHLPQGIAAPDALPAPGTIPRN